MKKYIQLYTQLRNSIAEGKYPPLTQLPTENELAEEYSMSRQTVRQALGLLRGEGYIYSVRGSGSFISTAGRRVPDNKRIAVITTYFSEYIFPAILRGISDATLEHGYTIELSTTNNSISTEKMVLTNLLQNSVAGIIVEGTKSALPNPNLTYYQKLSDSGVPIVFINSIYPELERDNVVSVVADDYTGGYILAKRLIDEGFTRIGGIFKSDDAQGLNRFAGVMSALVDNNIDFNDRDFVWFTTETKYPFIRTLESGAFFSDCNALICYNDEIVEILASHFRSIESKIKFVASFDRNLNPKVIPNGIRFYSLGHPKEQLGRAAANKLFNIIGGHQENALVLDWDTEMP